MFWSFVIVCAVAALALSGWVLAELELRDTENLLDEAELDLAVALGWEELTEDSLLRAIHPTLSLVDGGEA